MKCPQCHADNRDGAEFCGDCGRSLRSETTCPQCGDSNPQGKRFCDRCGHPLSAPARQNPAPAGPGQPAVPTTAGPSPLPTTFVGGRYQVKKFLGEGGKKKVYLAHDTVLDRDVAFALIKTEKLDETARTRIRREAQAMGRLGDHPNIVTVFDFGESPETNQPYMVLPLLSGGDVEGLIKKAADHKLPIPQSIEIARSVCRGLEFAHARGIIHRDIKPGNVWMSADGTAKVGDFGLAVAVDRSRLTQIGMMVGTVSYMPPEQAMGAEVTAKADLYSLGAMLYEMVTGRPPFVGDDHIAIIGQHINTPPISPSWHRADLPPSLETLIMQLLEKDPQKRPASATVVLQALDTIGTGKQAKTEQKATPPPENPLYRRVFVGREAELKQVQAAFDGAVSGNGGLWMVLGEPGIGKTALCEQLATYATLRGGKTLVGHCYEEGSLSLPYLAFVEAMRSYVLDRGVDELKRELGSGATDVARIVSEIREKLHVEPRKTENPEEDRYRLLQSVTSFLTNAASIKPLLVVLEDLHDADKGTLEMLTYVSRNLSGARLLIVGTYRDVEVDRTHPLSAALAELRRISSFGRVLLRGLNADEVSRMLAGIARESVPWSLAEAVHRQTEGNPLFVQEVIRYLNEQRLLMPSGSGKASASSLDTIMPEGLRDVIGKRLTFLSPRCNEVLSVAAVIGREFRPDVLQEVSGARDDELFSVLEEAKRAAVIEERTAVGRAVTYRFAHAFFRQTLYEETIAPRRIRLHLQVGRALETVYANRLEEHADELADHFSHSSDAADLKKAVAYGEMAARRATSVYAFGDAVTSLEQATRVQGILDPGDKAKRCDLLIATAGALVLAGDVRRVLDHVAPGAFSLAEEIGDRERAVNACHMAMWAVFWEEGSFIRGTPEQIEWIARTNRCAEADSGTGVTALLASGCIKVSAGLMTSDNALTASGVALVDSAVNTARRLAHTDSFWLASATYLIYASAISHGPERRRIAEELSTGEHGSAGLFSVGVGLVFAGYVFLEAGDRSRVDRLWGEHQALAQRTGQSYCLINAAQIDGQVALMDGRLADSVQIIQGCLARGGELGLSLFAGIVAVCVLPRPLLHLGRFEEALQFLAFAGVLSYGWHRALCLAHAGKEAEAAEALKACVASGGEAGTERDELPSFRAVEILEAATMLKDREVAGLLLDRLSSCPLKTTGVYWLTCVPRHLGGAAALLGRHDEARRHYMEAIRVCTEMRFRPELALTRLQFAELLLDHYPDQKRDALEHLDFAVKEFREMKMQPSLERALRRKEILKA
jgi:eukaryotic-like serine/threonine-protein kinase